MALAIRASVTVLSTSCCWQLNVRDALNSALDDELARDENVFVLGEEVTLRLSCSTMNLALAPDRVSPQRYAGGRVSGSVQGAPAAVCGLAC